MAYTSRPPHLVRDEIIGGRYLVIAELGRGGMSIVYRANDLVLDQHVALKLLRSSDEELRNLLFLQQEFRAMARLRHPRLVQVFDYGVLDTGTAYFTMELLPGTDLSSLRDLPLHSVFQILLSIADAFGFHACARLCPPGRQTFERSSPNAGARRSHRSQADGLRFDGAI